MMGSSIFDLMLITPPLSKVNVRERFQMTQRVLFFVVVACLALTLKTIGFAQEIIGTHVTPHQFSDEIKWRRAPNPDLSAKVDLFVQNNQSQALELSKLNPPKFDEKSPEQLLQSSDWAWHDTPSSWLDDKVVVPSNAVTVMTFNGMSSDWGTGTKHELTLGSTEAAFTIDRPTHWMSAVTFRSVDEEGQESTEVRPNQIIVYVENDDDRSFQIQAMKLWLPKPDGNHHVFHAAHHFSELDCFPSNGIIPPHDKGGLIVICDRLPLTYVVVELIVKPEDQEPKSLWAHLRIKREVFDISGGWVVSKLKEGNSLQIDDYLALLKKMHINAGQIQDVSGYTDNPTQYEKWPIKRFNRMWPLEKYDTDSMLPEIHAVEFLGEPQYGGGRPVPPQKVWEGLAPYQPSRLPTSLTLSEEHSWRYYAGISDYPHYDAYRVTAPAADSWRMYDRWGGERIRWGSPLETIGVMTRSLREQSRPRPIAYWSQGAHDGWSGFRRYRRTSPTPDELRSQAWHGLSNRVTSLYWYNLSLESLMKFPDLIDPIIRVNRESLMLNEIFLAGDAYEYERINNKWDLNSIATRDALLMVISDLDYQADTKKREFVFKPRAGSFQFDLPPWLKGDLQIFCVDANGTHNVEHRSSKDHVEVDDQIHVVGIYIATTNDTLRSRIDALHSELIALEKSTKIDPVNQESDLARLRQHLSK